MTTKNFKITIEYDGSDFHGWQRQKRDRTIQAEIEKALTTIVGRGVVVNGSGRTDAGVHALGQVANFRCDTRLNEAEIQKALNSLLTDAIVIRNCQSVDESFHARFDARAKTYRYRIWNQPTPVAVGRQYAWYIRCPLDIDAMQDATEVLIGRHDFKAFEASGSPRPHTIRHVFRAQWSKEDIGGYLAFEIEADGFLRGMVRNIVGTLICVGRGRQSAAGVAAILGSRDRRRAGETAPPHGLFLVRVTYEPVDHSG